MAYRSLSSAPFALIAPPPSSFDSRCFCGPCSIKLSLMSSTCGPCSELHTCRLNYSHIPAAISPPTRAVVSSASPRDRSVIAGCATSGGLFISSSLSWAHRRIDERELLLALGRFFSSRRISRLPILPSGEGCPRAGIIILSLPRVPLSFSTRMPTLPGAACTSRSNPTAFTKSGSPSATSSHRSMAARSGAGPFDYDERHAIPLNPFRQPIPQQP